MRVYKHIDPIWVDDFLTGKSVRVGTLSDFRNEEKHQLGIGDRLDASIEHMMNFSITPSERPDLWDRLQKDRIITFVGTGRPARMIFTENKFTRSFPDHYVFCASSSAEADLGYAAVVLIPDFGKLRRMIARQMRELGLIMDYGAHGPVTYQATKVDYESGSRFATAFTKDVSFAPNKEVRAVFRPSAQSIAPLNIKIDVPPGWLKRIK